MVNEPRVFLTFMSPFGETSSLGHTSVPLKPQNIFWAFFATALVASSLQGSLPEEPEVF